MLAGYLKEREVEVMDIMTTLFDEEEVMRRYINNTVKEVVNTTRKEDAETMAKKMLTLGTISYEDISKCTGIPIEELKELDALQTV